jgi:hypothetical protein
MPGKLQIGVAEVVNVPKTHGNSFLRNLTRVTAHCALFFVENLTASNFQAAFQKEQWAIRLSCG